MKFKILFSLITVVAVWWFGVRGERQSVTSRQSQPSVNSQVNNRPAADLQATAQQIKDIPSTVAIGSSLPRSKTPNQISPLPRVTNPPAAMPAPGQPIVLKPRPLAIDPVTNQLLSALMAAVISQESAGDHQVEHPISKATGLGQVLPANIPEWTRETFGQELTVEQFRNSSDAQMYVIRQKLFQYYGRAIAASGGDLYLAVRRVGAQWYSGQADLYDSPKPVATGPSIRDYTLQVLARFQNFYPQNYLVKY